MRTMNSRALTVGVTQGLRTISVYATTKERKGKMEQMPQWLTDAVQAAGMTAFAEGLEPKTLKHAPEPRQILDDDPPILPLH